MKKDAFFLVANTNARNDLIDIAGKQLQHAHSIGTVLGLFQQLPFEGNNRVRSEHNMVSDQVQVRFTFVPSQVLGYFYRCFPRRNGLFHRAHHDFKVETYLTKQLLTPRGAGS